MKYLPFLALLSCVAGCGLFGGSDSSAKPAPAGDPREAERVEIRGKINAKQADLDTANADIAKITSEREQLANQPASDSKTNRLVELARVEQEAKQRKASLTEDIASLQQQLGGTTAAPAAAKPTKAGDALDDLLAANDTKDKEDADRRKRKADEDAAADKDRLAQAETARKAEIEERSKQKIEGGRVAQGPDAPDFEDRWADVIQKIRTELQRYKRW